MSTTSSHPAPDPVEVRVRTAVRVLSESLAGGGSAELVAYLKAMARFHDYSFWNIVLIRSQRPDAMRVAGRQTWKRFKRRILSDDRGIEIRVPILPQWAYRLAPAKKRWMPCVGFRPGKVFDLSDTGGEPLPEFPTVAGNPGPYLTRLKRVIAAAGVALRYVSRLGGADGVSRGGLIEALSGMAPAKEFQVLVHELAHELLHGRKLRHPRLKTVIETEAEAVAFIVCHAAGLETGTASSDYITLYNGDTDVLRGSLSRIQRTARHILRQVGVGTLAEVESN